MKTKEDSQVDQLEISRGWVEIGQEEEMESKNKVMVGWKEGEPSWAVT